MPDREKVIKGLECCSKVKFGDSLFNDNMCNACPYSKPLGCGHDLAKDALVLLREQEPVEPNISDDGLPDEGGTWWYVCGNCSKAIDSDDAFCRHCGRAVKWD